MFCAWSPWLCTWEEIDAGHNETQADVIFCLSCVSLAKIYLQLYLYIYQLIDRYSLLHNSKILHKNPALFFYIWLLHIWVKTEIGSSIRIKCSISDAPVQLRWYSSTADRMWIEQILLVSKPWSKCLLSPVFTGRIPMFVVNSL